MAKEHPFAEQGLYVPDTHIEGGMLPIPGGGTGRKAAQTATVRGTASRVLNQMQRNLINLATPTGEGGLATDEDIEAGRNWYPTAQEHARRISTMVGGDHRIASALISSLSPQTEWEQNLIKAHDFARYGRPTSELAGWGPENVGKTSPEFSRDARIRKASAILQHAQTGGTGDGRFNVTMRGWNPKTKEITEPRTRPVFDEGLKTHNFMENIHTPSNPQFVTIDTHAHNAAVASRTGSDKTGLGSIGRYNMFADAYHGAARHFDIPASELQARVWTTWKRMNPMAQGRVGFDDYLKQTGKFDDYYSR